MGNDLKREYRKLILERYSKSTKAEKNLILDEFCQVSGLSRKYAIRKLNQELRGILQRNKPGRKEKYSDKSKQFLRKFWRLMSQMCSKKMKAAFPIWLEYYQDPELDKRTRIELLEMSPATMDRILNVYRSQFYRNRRSGTKSVIKAAIPIKPLDQEVKYIGFMQADSVAHCGDRLSGSFVWSLTMTDVVSGWTENRGKWCNSAESTIRAMKDIEEKLPFDLYGVNTDGGSEFLNYQLLAYADKTIDRPRKLNVTRSRAYKKNDNCHVEQKNFTHVREVFGYERFDHKELVEAMDEVYKYSNLLSNFFVPQMRLQSKVRIGSKIKRKYTKPKTPYQILLDREDVPEDKKELLKKVFFQHNPFHLRGQIELKLKAFFKLRSELDSMKNSEAA